MHLKYQITQLEYAFRSVGSGGPATEASRALRKSLEAVEYFLGINSQALFQDLNITLAHLEGDSFMLTLFLAWAHLTSSDNPELPSNALKAFADLRIATYKLSLSLICFVELYYDSKLMTRLDNMRTTLTVCLSLGEFTYMAYLFSCSHDCSQNVERHLIVLRGELIALSHD